MYKVIIIIAVSYIAYQQQHVRCCRENVAATDTTPKLLREITMGVSSTRNALLPSDECCILLSAASV
jgi:hypothetical protein